MTLVAEAYAQINAHESGSPTIGSAGATANLGAAVPFASGNGVGAVDTVYAAHRSIAGSGTDNLDLNGSLVDALGNSVALLHVNAILVVADAANAGDLTVGAGTNPFLGPLGGTTPTVNVRPGGILMIADPGAGWPVTASTADILKVLNTNAAAAGYQVSVIGRSA